MELGKVYFWTSTIKDWKVLLKQDKYKRIIIDILKELHSRSLIAIYGFVIMPNHIHLLWELLAHNGKEMPHASFNKGTAHEIVKDLKANHIAVLDHFKVEEKERQFRIWQRDPLAILMDSKGKFEQKLNYVHDNPLSERWNLALTPEDYYWSSSSFYVTGKDNLGFLTHYTERFG
jgi:REP element-mobilizing transposase RayT